MARTNHKRSVLVRKVTWEVIFYFGAEPWSSGMVDWRKEIIPGSEKGVTKI